MRSVKDLVGLKVGPYYIEAPLGRGSAGAVFRALNGNDEPIALKVFVSSFGAENDTLLSRFKREAQIVAGLDHPHIVPVLDMGDADGNFYMAMRLIKGETLEAKLKKKNRFDELTTTEIGWQIADALNHAYDHGVIHRDVKPSNILLTPDGHALLTDFGVAHALDGAGLTQAGQILGTPAYMAPEQVMQASDVEGRSDLYSLGVVLYRMVTGRLPFVGTTPELLHAHAYEPLPAPSSVAKVSPDLNAIIVRALQKEVADRFPDGRALARALLELNLHLQAQAKPAKFSVSAVKRWFSRRRR